MFDMIILVYQNEKNQTVSRLLLEHHLSPETADATEAMLNDLSVTHVCEPNEMMAFYSVNGVPPKTYNIIEINEFLGDEDVSSPFAWRHLAKTERNVGAVTKFFEMMKTAVIREITASTGSPPPADGEVQLKRRFALFYLNSQGIVSFRILSQYNLSEESRNFGIMSMAKLNLTDYETIGYVCLAPKEELFNINAGEIHTAEGPYYKTKFHGRNGLPNIAWSSLAETEISVTKTEALYEILDKNTPDD